MKGDWTDILVIGGGIIVCVGIGLIYYPAGIIAAGVGILALGVLSIGRDSGHNQDTNP